jgi:hypothetical protein
MDLAQEWAEKALKNKQTYIEAIIPVQYQEYANVFLEEAAQRFPPL